AVLHLRTPRLPPNPPLPHLSSPYAPPYNPRLYPLCIVPTLCELHATRLAPPAGQYLRLHDDAAVELLRRRTCFGRRRREAAVGDRDVEAPKELLALVLVEVHGG